MRPSLAVSMRAPSPGPANAPTAVRPPVPVQPLSLAEPLPGFPGHRDYVPRLPDSACDELGLGDVSDAQIYCLVTVPDGDVAASTANLRAPVVVNPATRQARQVVLLDPAHPFRRPLRR